MYEVATQQSGEMVSRNTQTEMMISRQAQEVQGAMVIAKRFPRDEVESFNRIMQSCKRKSLAESAMYEYPRGGTKVSGPSIRLAEAMAQNWGKGPINDRIAFYNSLIAQHRWKIMKHCTHIIEAFEQAVYDEKKKNMDVRLDDGLMNVDSLDSTEYSTESVQDDILYIAA